uniref:AH domain-containing protein n=1 Tax=Syphacia muris TaxID=451379 RepID=A0A0N5AKF1_9BILA
MGSTRFYETNTSGLNSDRYVDHFDDSTLTKVQAQFWTAKQLLRKKLGKKEDEHLLASDAEFDAKVDLFKALQSTSEQMLICVDDYQHYLELTQTEVSLGQMLNTKSRDENGDTSKALAAVGKVQSSPLIRFMEELRVFSDRAILDCLSTVEAAEKAQTEYRGSLLWMKKTSVELDPEAENALEKFRKAQCIVRKNKEKLDSLKMDTLQKVDLLAASRCNLLAQLLETYQKCLYDFYEQGALAYAKIYDLVNSSKKYQFEILKVNFFNDFIIKKCSY